MLKQFVERFTTTALVGIDVENTGTVLLARWAVRTGYR